MTDNYPHGKRKQITMTEAWEKSKHVFLEAVARRERSRSEISDDVVEHSMREDAVVLGDQLRDALREIARLRADNERLQRELFEQTAMRLGFEGNNEWLRAALEVIANDHNAICTRGYDYCQIYSDDYRLMCSPCKLKYLAADALRGEGGDDDS